MVAVDEVDAEAGDGGWGGSAVVDDELDEVGEVFGPGPGLDGPPLVGAQQPEEACGGEDFADGLGGDPGVGGGRELHFDLADGCPWEVLGGEFEHGEAVFLVGDGSVLLVWGLAAGDEEDLVEVQGVAGGAGDLEVAEVDGVEASANLFGPGPDP